MFENSKIENYLKIDNCPPKEDPPPEEKLNIPIFRCYDAS